MSASPALRVAPASPSGPRTVLAPAPAPAPAPEPRPVDEGHGRRLIRAFEALEGFPALIESRNRLIGPTGGRGGAVDTPVAAIESDVALVVAVMRLANEASPRARSKVETIADAVRLLGPEAVQAIAERAGTFDFFDRSAEWGTTPERFRLHALATRSAVEALASEIHYRDRDRLIVAAMLHDVGKVVLTAAFPAYADVVNIDTQTPEQRIMIERREFGVDHALVGGVLTRRWGLPKSIATAIERHHADETAGDAPLIRLADILAHYAHGNAVSPAVMLRVALSAGVSAEQLRAVLYSLPQFSAGHKRRVTEECPLSPREYDVLRALATGKLYKQIAASLTLSTSTIRTHTHHMYRKLGAADRAQAVLIATAHGWL